MRKNIISNPNILGGTPVVKGTRVPVGRILFLFKQGYTIDDIHTEYDHIDVKTLEKVLDELTTMTKNAIHEPQTA